MPKLEAFFHIFKGTGLEGQKFRNKEPDSFHQFQGVTPGFALFYMEGLRLIGCQMEPSDPQTSSLITATNHT